LQCIAVCCSALQCVAVCCSVRVTMCCSVHELRHELDAESLKCSTHVGLLPCVCCSVLQSVAVCCSALQCVAVYYSALQCETCVHTTNCDSAATLLACVLQCVAVNCSGLQCVPI